MPMFRKIPVVVQARLVEADNLDELANWCGGSRLRVGAGFSTGQIVVPTRHGKVLASIGDHLIQGVEGEFYPCEPSSFAKTYKEEIPRPGFDFGEALAHLNAGERVRRAGWNGKDMHIALMPGYMEGVPANEHAARAMGCRPGDEITVRPYFMMKDAQGYMVPGWLASQADMIATDWELAD